MNDPSTPTSSPADPTSAATASPDSMVSPTRRQPSTDGVSIALWRLSDGDDSLPPVLIAHATGFCATAYRPIAIELSRRTNATVWGLDFRGHGHSTEPDGTMNWAGMGDDVGAALDGIGAAGPIAAFGHSMGGAALFLCEQATPGRFSALTVFEPIVFPPTVRSVEGDNPLAAGARRRRAEFDSLDAARQNFSSKPPMAAFRADALEGYLLGGFGPVDAGDDRVRLLCTPEREAECFEMGPRHDAFDHLGEIAVPTLVIAGHEPVGPAAFAPPAAAALPNGRLDIMPTLDHFGPFVDPVMVADAIAT